MAADPTDTSLTTIRINELFPNPIDEKNEWIELYNFGSSPIDLSTGWKVKDKTTAYDFSRESDTIIPPSGYKIVGQATSKIELNNTNETVSLTKGDATVDLISYGTTKEEKSYGYDGSAFAWSDFLTPGTVNRFESDQEDNGSDPKNEEPTVPETSVIRINELFPNPVAKGEENEWIELYNPGDTDANISGFALRDASASGKYIFPSGTVVPSDGYLVVERSESELSLNNTDETVSLSDASGNVVDTMTYEKTKEEASLSFDGVSFRWSPFLTPGKENRFGEKPETEKTSVPEEGFKDVPLEFTASGSDGQEFLWNFGDGKTSRKQAASHTYRKTGEYNGTLTITDEDGITESVKEFTIDIGDFPKVKLSITAIAPNPKGADTGAEWISVKNGGKKKLDLLGFGIATGSSKKKLSNHPVSESLVIKAGKEKQITSASASFTLPNENGYVEIRRPDGKMIVGRSYKKSGGVKDDEIWRKIAGKSWEWVKEPSKNPKKEIAEAAPEKSPDEEPETTATESVPVTTPETEAPKKEITLEDLSPEQLALLEARVEERLRGQILAELEASGKLAVAPEADTDTDSGAVLGTSDEKPTAPLFQELNALLGKMLFGN